MPGDEGDLFVHRQLRFRICLEYMNCFFYFGGHAGYVDDNNSIYETYGFIEPDENLINVIINGGKETHGRFRQLLARSEL